MKNFERLQDKLLIILVLKYKKMIKHSTAVGQFE